ncbi:hypothetical protein ACLOJK_030340 [Asimina triloba]
MGFCTWKITTIAVMLGLLSWLGPASGIRFVLDREECFSYSVEYGGQIVHVSFVAMKSDTSWYYRDDGVDLVHFLELTFGGPADLRYLPLDYDMGSLAVKSPKGIQIHDSRSKTSEKFKFTVRRRGVHRFCFTNKSPSHQTIDFDVYVEQISYMDEHAKDEHLTPLLEQIAKLEEALSNVQFEQHWLEAQTDRQAMVNKGLSRRTIHKAIFESLALVGASMLQVYLLQRLFERKPRLRASPLANKEEVPSPKATSNMGQDKL